MEELKILDELLEALKDTTEVIPMSTECLHAYKSKLFKSNRRDRQTIMDKLIKDGYAQRLLDDPSKYYISYDGLIFLKKGGYEKEYKKQKTKDFYDEAGKWIVRISGVLTIIFTISKLYPYFKNFICFCFF